jgi:hypothetical protein
MNKCTSCLLHEVSVVYLICIVSTCHYIVLSFVWFSIKLLLCCSNKRPAFACTRVVVHNHGIG